MAVIISGISLPFGQPPQEAIEQARRMLQGETVGCGYLVKQSVDARKQNDIRFVYTVGLELTGDEEKAAQRLNRSGVSVKKPVPLELARGRGKLPAPPVVVGFGPAGMFAALLLAREGLRPVVLERGSDVDRRVERVQMFWKTGILDPECNVQFGEGGAGTFSDGKLTTRIGDPRCGYVLSEFHRHGAPEEILYLAKPHVGTDRLRQVVRAIREEIISLGGQVLFDTRMTGLRLESGKITGVETTAGPVAAGAVILAPGHSARDVFTKLLEQGISMLPKPFSVGVRIEHLQSEIDRALYGSQAGHPLLPKGEYQLSHRENGRGVYTFCMCPGGVVVPSSSEEEMVVTNGMSEYARDGRNSNSAVVVSVEEGDFGSHPLAGMEFQRRLETAAYGAGGKSYAAPAQTVGRFLEGKAGFDPCRVEPSYAIGVKPADFGALFPQEVTQLLRSGLQRFGRKMKGFDAPDSFLTGIETRTSSPVRIPRNEDLQAEGITGLYPCGEGAGYAGGIVSAAVDGVRVAQKILEQFGE